MGARKLEVETGLERRVLCGCVAHVVSESVRLWVQFLSSSEKLLTFTRSLLRLKEA